MDQELTEKPKSWKDKALGVWRKHLRPLVLMVLIVTVLRSTAADWNDVPTGSMEPTILAGDRIFVNKLAYDLKVPFTTIHLAKWDDPTRGDIVIFYSPEDGTRLVKRVVGVPGDTVQLLDDRLIVNGAPAHYASLPQSFINQIGEDDPSLLRGHELAQETVAGRSHAVMATPFRAAMRTFGPVTVPAGHYFMMGDNRDNSKDSRYIGVVSRDLIVGRATAVVVSVDLNNHYAPRWDRFFHGLQ